MDGEAEEQAAEAAAFAAGLADSTPTPAAAAVETPPAADGETPPVKADETPAVVASTETPAAETPPADKPAVVEKPPAPKYVRVTEEQLAELQAAASKIKGFDSKFDKLNGTTGSLKKTLEQLQAATPKGQKIDFDPATLAGLKQDFPELAAHLEKILGGLKGTGADAPKPEAKEKPASDAAPDAEQIKRDLNKERIASELEELNARYPEWMNIVGKSDAPDAKNPFRAWLATQSAEYQKKINNTHSPEVISGALDTFNAATATPRTPPPEKKATPAAKIPAASARRDQIANAVPPKTAGGAPPVQAKTEADHFADGLAGR